jgi:hypothetical protein
MQKVAEFFKSIVFTTAGIVSLLTVVYVGAIGFMAAIIVDKLLQVLGSKLTVDRILLDFETLYQSRTSEYRQTWDKFHFRDLKLPF